MKIRYVANIRIPTEKAHGAQIMKTCEAFVKAGHEVELIVPTRHNSINESPFSYYNIQHAFPITFLTVLDTVGWGRIGFFIETIRFARAARAHLLANPGGIIYGRDEWVLAVLAQKNVHPIVWESHTGASNYAARKVLRRATRIVTISEGLKMKYQTEGMPAAHVTVAPDGVDLGDFGETELKEKARLRLGIPPQAHVALYVGKFDPFKGSELFAVASDHLPPYVTAALIGGEPAQIAALQKMHPRALFLGSHPYRELSKNLAAADVLILPNSAKSEVSARFTSPLKLFAYMASGIPIVASDVPSIREVLNEESAQFFAPDDPYALAQAIDSVFSHQDLAKEKAARAKRMVERYTWDARAHTILESLKGL